MNWVGYSPAKNNERKYVREDAKTGFVVWMEFPNDAKIYKETSWCANCIPKYEGI